MKMDQPAVLVRVKKLWYKRWTGGVANVPELTDAWELESRSRKEIPSDCFQGDHWHYRLLVRAAGESVKRDMCRKKTFFRMEFAPSR